uniref:t-SNARE coiled-coil homology domain-containing protein n=1 Tax=Caenorhabditis tropicalis TaxID=1561998 RepID=A0A1I7UUZ0_9PELO
MSRNPFDDDYRPSAASSTNPVKSYTTMGHHSEQDEADMYEREIERTLQESLDSTERSRRHLENSEKIGTATAQQLLEQREKLENTERNLDEIHRTTQMTQRNLNSLKSFFGGFFKNKLSKKPQEPGETSSTVPQSKSASRLSETTTSISTSGGSFSGPSGQRTLNESSRNAIKGTRWEAMDNQIDENLDMMSANLRNLQRLGQDLGKEVDDQNKMLDRIHYKADRNDAIVRDQDKQMQKILGTGASTSQTTAESLTPSMDTSTKMSLMMKATSLWK